MNQEKWNKFLNKVHKEFCDKGPDSSDSGFSNEAFHMANEGLAYGGTNLEYLKDCKKIIDIGCGVAHTLKILKDLDRDRQCFGITFNQEEVEASHRRYGNLLRIIPGDMHDLPYPDGFFDGAIMWEVLEHSLAPQVALWECSRVLKEGGRLMVFIPSDVYIEFDVHFILPTIRQMKEMLCKASFIIDYVRDWGGDQARYWCKKDSSKSLKELREINKKALVVGG